MLHKESALFPKTGLPTSCTYHLCATINPDTTIRPVRVGSFSTLWTVLQSRANLVTLSVHIRLRKQAVMIIMGHHHYEHYHMIPILSRAT
ncbi:hypothetical protein L596_001356 [Steinernema carpocapsae]|uniref:Uncharacterized protein n=1 Tax=Steinernema carpocapsae TaxID=34508 RepID=A0A4U8UNI8_STECR|nr:hypothetical protein L596_001356 [Steinernema carpocapsae]